MRTPVKACEKVTSELGGWFRRVPRFPPQHSIGYSRLRHNSIEESEDIRDEFLNSINMGMGVVSMVSDIINLLLPIAAKSERTIFIKSFGPKLEWEHI